MLRLLRSFLLEEFEPAELRRWAWAIVAGVLIAGISNLIDNPPRFQRHTADADSLLTSAQPSTGSARAISDTPVRTGPPVEPTTFRNSKHSSDGKTAAPSIEREAAALLRWAAEQGIQARITSMRRTAQEQAELYANRRSNPYPVAPPGQSLHEVGRAFDLVASPEELVRLGAEWEQRGGHWGGHFGDPIHFER